VGCCGGVEVVGANNQNVDCEQPLLTLNAKFVQQNVARIAQQLLVVHKYRDSCADSMKSGA
jgi:hypothetical protein